MTDELKTGLRVKALLGISFQPNAPNRENSTLTAESLLHLHFKLSWHYFTHILAMAASRHHKALRVILQVFGRILSPTNPPFSRDYSILAEMGIRSLNREIEHLKRIISIR
jgi:hypothetical protein